MTGREPTIAAILFDKDGTLFDFQATWGTWADRMIADLAGDDAGLANRLAAAVGYDRGARRFLPHSMVIAGTPDDVVTALAPELGTDPETLLSRLNAAAASVEAVSAVPLVPLLGGLRAKGLRLGVATNDAQAPALAHLEQAGVADQFDFVTGSDGAFAPKPDPAMCLGFARALRLDPAQVMMVGDSLHDLNAGRAAGMRTIGVLTGVAARDELAPMADAVLAHIGALPDWLAQVSE